MKKRRILAIILAIAMVITQFTCIGTFVASATGVNALTANDGFIKGVNLHNSGHYSYRNLYNALLDAKSLGVNTVRFNSDPGKNGYSEYEIGVIKGFVDIANELGMDVMLVLDGFDQFHWNYTDKVPFAAEDVDDALITSVYTPLVTALAGKVKYYQLGNENDNKYYKLDASQYAGLVKALVTLKGVINNNDGDAQTVINFGWNHYNFLQNLINEGVEWDVTGLDWYASMSYNEDWKFDYNDVIDTVVSMTSANTTGKVIVCETNITPNGDVEHPERYLGDAEWLADFAAYCNDEEDVLGFIVYELYDEKEIEDVEEGEDPIYDKEAHFGMFTQEREIKPIGSVVREIFGGEEIVRDTAPEAPTPAYGSEATMISQNGVMYSIGYSWSWDSFKVNGLENVDISDNANIEFDLYVEDYASFMAALNDTGMQGQFRFRLNSDGASGGANMLYGGFSASQITESGWNHIIIPISALSNVNFNKANVTGLLLYFECGNKEKVSPAAGMVFGIANIAATGESATKVPALNPVMGEVVATLGSQKTINGWERAWDRKLNQEGFAVANCSTSDYIEFDIYVESKAKLDAAIKAMDDEYGGSHRMAMRIGTGVNNDNLRLDDVSAQITKDGWNHIVCKREGTVFGTFDPANVTAWYIVFENTFTGQGLYFTTDNIKNMTMSVANVVATTFAPPEAKASGGRDIVATLGSTKSIDGWERAWDRKLNQEGLTAADFSTSDYIEFDIFVKSKAKLDAAIKAMDDEYGGSHRMAMRIGTGVNNDNLRLDDVSAQITKDGWNHIVCKREGTVFGTFDPANVTAWYIVFENTFSGQGLYFTADNIANMTMAVANVIGTSVVVPEAKAADGHDIVATLGSTKSIDGWERAWDRKLNQEGLTAADFSTSDYIEFDIFVESKAKLDAAIKAMDDEYGGSHRMAMRIGTGVNNDNLRLDEVSAQITQDGWNHIVYKREGTVFGTFDPANVTAWYIVFENTFSGQGLYFTGDNIANMKMIVANIIGTVESEEEPEVPSEPPVIPEAKAAGGRNITATTGTSVVTNAWNNANFVGLDQNGLPVVSYGSLADYLEFDVYVESKAKLDATIAYLNEQDPGKDYGLKFSLYANGWKEYDHIENFVANDGWNHIVIPVTDSHWNGGTWGSINGWRLSFNRTPDIALPAKTTINGTYMAVANVIGTKVVVPEAQATGGRDIVTTLGSSKTLDGWPCAYTQSMNQEKQSADFTNAQYLEFDIYVESKAALDAAIAAMDADESSKDHRMSMRLSPNNNPVNSTRFDPVNSQITKDGWNHIVYPVSGLGNITAWYISFENTWDHGYGLVFDNNTIANKKMIVANVIGTAVVIPEAKAAGGRDIVTTLGSSKTLDGWPCAYTQSMNQEKQSADFTNAQYLEFDIYVESKAALDAAIAAMDADESSKDHRMSMRLSPNNVPGNSTRFDSVNSQITKDGWNHIVYPVSGLGNITAWYISFENTWDHGYGLVFDNNTIANKKMIVANVIGTAVVIPEAQAADGRSIVTTLGSSKTLDGWPCAYTQGMNQEKQSANFAKAQYLEFDIYVESKAALDAAIAAMDADESSKDHRMSMRLSPNNNPVNSTRFDSVNSQITKDGWNHIVYEINGNLGDISAWYISFENTWDHGYGLEFDNNTIANKKMIVANVIGTAVVPGDVDKDGVVDEKEVNNVLDIILDNEEYNPILDLNDDGTIDVLDFIMVKLIMESSAS